MKKIIRVVSIILITLIFSGCSKNLDKMTYTKYNEYFSNKDGYVILDKTGDYDIDIRRYIESGNGNIQIFYIEFQNKKTATEYINSNYGSLEDYKVKTEKKYTFIKNTKKQYFKLYQVDNVVIYALAVDKKYKKDVNKVLKDLGY